MSRRLRRTKIVTTLGPATDRDNNLEKVIAAGANVVRMNFSHGTPEDHQLRADKVREIAAKLGRHVAILGDLQGPKIRVSTFKEGKIFLNVGDKFLLDANLGKGEGDKEKVGIDYKGLPADVVPGDILRIPGVALPCLLRVLMAPARRSTRTKTAPNTIASARLRRMRQSPHPQDDA